MVEEIDEDIVQNDLARRKRPRESSLELLSVTRSLPPPYHSVFPYSLFNQVQTECFSAFTSDTNLVISAPTGSGKTSVFELAICRLHQMRAETRTKFEGDPKVVYLAPLRALCAERAQDWQVKFRHLSLNVKEVSGDITQTQISLQSADVICTTPEKWDSLTRAGGLVSSKAATLTSEDDLYFQFGLASQVALLCVDEVHNIADRRGGTLEAVISRMKMTRALLLAIDSRNAPAKSLRVIAASATVPNVDDLRDWLDPCEGVYVGQSVRPCKLSVHVLGYRVGQPFLFESSLNSRLLDILLRYNNEKPALVFCPSRKSANTTANALYDQIKAEASNPFLRGLIESERSELRAAAVGLHDKTLRTTVQAGIACHNAGLSAQDRSAVEELFRRAVLRLVCTTTTLAQGVNLPAHLVVIKSTLVYQSGGFVEYQPSLITQMLGRAGRPQFDREGVAVIMTRIESVPHYELVAAGEHESIESRLKSDLPEQMNAEVCRGTIRNRSGVALWLRQTFLWTRARSNPSFYHLDGALSRRELEDKLKEIANHALTTLKEAGLVHMSEDGDRITSTNSGRVMARYYVQFETMRMLLQSCGACNDVREMLAAISLSNEFKDVLLRRSEKAALNAVSKKLPFPLKSRVSNAAEKVFILLQATLYDGSLLGELYSLKMEATHLLPIFDRIARCVATFLRAETGRGHLRALLVSHTLARAATKRLWPEGPAVLRQLPGIGPVMTKQLNDHGVTSFDVLRKHSARSLESMIGKNPPFGDELLAKVAAVPHLSVDARWLLSRKLLVTSCSMQAAGALSATGTEAAAVFLAVGRLSGPCQSLLTFTLRKGETRTHELCLPNLDMEGDDAVRVYLGAEDWLGADALCNIRLRSGTNAHELGASEHQSSRKTKKDKSNLQMLRNKAQSIPDTPVQSLRHAGKVAAEPGSANSQNQDHVLPLPDRGGDTDIQALATAREHEVEEYHAILSSLFS